MHGGLTPSGIASPHFKTGLHSAAKDALPSRLIADFEKAIDDPELLSIRDAVAVAVARRNDLLRRVDTGESGEIWNSLKATYRAAEDARETMNHCGDIKRRVAAELSFWQAFETVGTLIAEGAADYHAWDEALAADEHRRKLVDSERGRLKDLGAMVTAQKALALIAAVKACVVKRARERIPDDKQRRRFLQAVQNDLIALLGRDSGMDEEEELVDISG